MNKSYLSVNILRVDSSGDCTNDGVTAPHNSGNTMMLVPADGGNFSSDYADELLEKGKAVIFDFAENGYSGYSFFKEKDAKAGAFGGNFLYSTDSRFSETYGHRPLPVHDYYDSCVKK